MNTVAKNPLLKDFDSKLMSALALHWMEAFVTGKLLRHSSSGKAH